MTACLVGTLGMAGAAIASVDVYLIAGQSNATGQGYVAKLPPGITPAPEVMIFHSERVISGKSSLEWHSLCPASEDPQRFGPELGFGNHLAQLEPDRRIAIIKHAVSGTGLAKDWNPGENAADRDGFGPEFAAFVETVEAGLAALEDQGHTPVIRAMLWQQGERDASEKEGLDAAEAYAGRMQHFIARCREQVESPGMLFCYGLVLPRPTGFQGRDLVRQAQRDLDQDSGSDIAVPGALLVETDDLSLRSDDPDTPYPHDTVHFGTAGTYHLGLRLAARVHWERVLRGDRADDPALDPAPVFWDPPATLDDERRRFQGIPGIERAPGGRLWATWYTGGTGEGPENVAVLVTSDDDGETWSPLQLAIDPPGNVRAFDPCLWLSPDGKLWLFYAQSRSWYDGRAGVWAIVTAEPDAARPTWAAPRRLSHGIMMNKPLVLSTGEWLLPSALWDARGAGYAELNPMRAANAIVSHDQGQTWQFLGGAAIPEQRNCDEHMFMEHDDGRLRMFIRTGYGIGESISEDRGRTWTPAEPSSIAHTTSRFFVRTLASGRWLLIKHGAIDERAKRSDLTAYLSDDEGKTWSDGWLIDKRLGVSYPDAVEAPDGTIYLIYDYSRTGAKEILMATFTEEDVLAGSDVSGKVRRRVMVNKATGNDSPDPESLERRDNADGEPLLNGPSPELELGDELAVRPLKEGEPIWNDRHYTLFEVPKGLQDKQFVQSSIEHVSATCREPGVVYVLTPLPDRNGDSVLDELKRQGFVKAAVPEALMMLLSSGEANLVSVFQKPLKQGETVTLGKWGVIVF